MYLLLGYGLSNKSIEKYFKKNKINYLIHDDKLNIINDNLNNIKIIIKSNGINNNHYILKEASNKNIKIISDLQYFYEVTNNNNYCLVTGSNGKTTVVSLIEKVTNNTIAIGNNCLPFFDYISNKKNKILEVSSFMLENINYINYKYNIITNLYPTHLEHHSNYINYIKSKLSFLKYLNKNDYLIYNKDDLLLDCIIKKYDCIKINVSLYDTSSTVYYKNNYIYYKNKKVLNIKKIKLLGNHNIYNIMLVLAFVFSYNNYKINYKNIIYNYIGEKYRLNVIFNKQFKIINDSKSTNFNSLSVALDCFKENIVVIVGGKKRNDNYNILKNKLNKIKKVYCYGENKDDFYNFFINNKILCYKYNDLNDLINDININENEILLFSPGSVSYDQYKDYIERGEHFNKLIKNKYNF